MRENTRSSTHGTKNLREICLKIGLHINFPCVDDVVFLVIH